MIEARAPGKLIVLGEYAVLAGAPAIVAAVDRQAAVRLEAVDGTAWSVTAPQVGDRTFRFSIDGASIAWAGDDLPLLTPLLEALAEPLARSTPCHLALDTHAFYRDGRKMGLGSSAALCVATARALLQHLEDDRDRDRLFDLADAAHRSFQHGRGSGADIAASVAGGIVAFRREPRKLDPLPWPEELHALPIWTGRSTSTTRTIEHLAAWRDSDPRRADRRLEALGEEAERGLDLFAAGRIEAFLEAVDCFTRCLDDLGAAAGLAIFSPEHRRVAEAARGLGIRYKPSGAGDGDFGIALACDLEPLERLGRWAREHHFATPLPISPWAASGRRPKGSVDA